MAQKRMFSLSVVDTDKFLEMPISSRLLYYELGMRADDDGFVNNWKKILLFTGLKEDDMKVLISKQFVIPFESGVIVIRHWRLNNYLQKDRTKPTIYQEELAQLDIDNNNVYNLYTDCIHSIDKNSIDKNSIDVVVKENKKNKILICYEENIGLMTPATAELLYSYLDTFSEDIVCEAIKKASIANKRNTKYICGILNDWQNKNIKTLVDIDEEEQNYKARQNKNVVKVETEEEATQRKIKALEEAVNGNK